MCSYVLSIYAYVFMYVNRSNLGINMKVLSQGEGEIECGWRGHP